MDDPSRRGSPQSQPNHQVPPPRSAMPSAPGSHGGVAGPPSQPGGPPSHPLHRSETAFGQQSQAALGSRSGFRSSRPSMHAHDGPVEMVGGIYQVRKELGRGAMGRILLAKDIVLNRRVAIKLPLTDQAASMLLSEGRALAALSHPSLPTIHAAGNHDGKPFLVMELLHGTSLEERLELAEEHGQSIGMRECVSVLTCMAEALHAIHAAGIAHRDIKPENVLVCKRGPVLIDFGLVVPEYDASDQRVYGGSPLYVSPEVIKRNEMRGAGALSDLYSLGITAYELLTGTVPFDADTLEDILRMHVEAPIPDPRMLRPNIPGPLAELITELMAKQPGRRPQVAEDVVWRLKRVAKELPDDIDDGGNEVLIVCDDAGVCSQLKVAFRSWVPDCEVTLCTTQAQAQAALEKAVPDFMLVDLARGGVNGAEFLMQLRGSELAWPRSVVALPGGADAADLDFMRHLDVQCFVPKGRQMMNMLEHVVRRVLVPCLDPSRASLIA